MSQILGSHSPRRMMRAACRSLALLAVVAAPMVAQSASDATTARRPTTGTPRICDMSLRIVTMRLVDGAGQPITDATVTLRRPGGSRRGGASLDGVAGAMTQGDYKIAEDGTIADLRAGGEPFDVVFVRGGQTKRVRVRLGKDRSQCHVALLAGPAVVRM